MNIVAITKHADLVERIQAAIEEGEHRIKVIPDQLQALGLEAWNDAQLVLVDASGDPLDGFRFCDLLRGDSRYFFQDLSIFMVLDQPTVEIGPRALDDAHIDGFLHVDDGRVRILEVIGPAINGHLDRKDTGKIPILAVEISTALVSRIGKFMDHFGFRLHPCPLPELPPLQEKLNAPLLLLGLDPSNEDFRSAMQRMQDSPYVIHIGRYPNECLERKPTMGRGIDWIPLPPSNRQVLNACRKAMQWRHLRRIQRELQIQMRVLRERRQILESETSSLRSEVLTDPLTELLNRRAFKQNLELAINQWTRHRRPFVLILGDVDYFKLINDRFGHLVGDQVLKNLSERIRGSLRRSDLAFRIGGEEFAIILMETGLQAGAEVADKLRRKIDENPIHLETGQSIFPTLSFGVGTPANHDADTLCVAVDGALNIAKHKGRNRIEVVPDKDESGITC